MKNLSMLPTPLYEVCFSSCKAKIGRNYPFPFTI